MYYSKAEVTFVNFYKDDLDNVNDWSDEGKNGYTYIVWVIEVCLMGKH